MAAVATLVAGANPFKAILSMAMERHSVPEASKAKDGHLVPEAGSEGKMNAWHKQMQEKEQLLCWHE